MPDLFSGGPILVEEIPPTPPEDSSAAAPAAPDQPVASPPRKSTPAEIVLIVMAVVAALSIARPVILPVFLACMMGMTLKPLIDWLSRGRVPRALSAAVVMGLLVFACGIGFVQLGRPALAWMNDAPEHMTELRQRVQKLFPRLAHFSQAVAAVNDLGVTEEEKMAERVKSPTVEVKVKDNRGASVFLNWTGTLLMGVVETLVLAYLLLASGDLFLQKFVHVMPTLSDKKRAVEISREIQLGISTYLYSVSLINLGLGCAVGAGLAWLGVPNAVMWGVLVAVMNFVPYFGPIVGVILLAGVGLLTFDTLGHGLLPPAWYLALHLLEANLVTPILLGRRFTLNPVGIFISLIFWTWLWGVPGALLSVPLLVSFKVVCDRVPRLLSVSELLAD